MIVIDEDRNDRNNERKEGKGKEYIIGIGCWLDIELLFLQMFFNHYNYIFMPYLLFNSFIILLKENFNHHLSVN